MARQRHSGLKEQYCPICNQTYAPGTREFNVEHIVPHALGNRNWVLRICKACNTQMNEIDQEFNRLPDLVQGRMEFGHTDRKHHKAESKQETLLQVAGLNIRMRPRWDGEKFVPFTVPGVQRQYGTGPLYQLGADPTTPEGREKLQRDVQKLIERRVISGLLPTTPTLLHLPTPRQATHAHAHTRIEVGHDIRIREVLKVLLESLSTYCNPRFNELSCMPVVRELLFLQGEEPFFQRMYQLEQSGFFLSFHHLMKVPLLPGQPQVHEVLHGGQSLHFQQHPFDADGFFEGLLGPGDSYEHHTFVLLVTELDFGQGPRSYLTWNFVYYGYFYGSLFLPLQESDEVLLNAEPFYYGDEVQLDGKHHPLPACIPALLQKTARKG